MNEFLDTLRKEKERVRKVKCKDVLQLSYLGLTCMRRIIVKQFVQNVLKPSSCEADEGLITPRGGKKVEIEFCTIPHHMSTNYMSRIHIKYTRCSLL